jgi:hypothetical protein
MPELSIDRTATRITACSAMPAPGMPMVSGAATKGDLLATSVFHGLMITIRRVELTKKNRMRKTTLFTARRMLRPGSADSAAAIQAAVLRRWAVGLSPRTRLNATDRAKALA